MNGLGCSSSAGVGVTSVGNTVAVTASATSPCVGGTVELTATTNTPGVAFIWTGPNGFMSTEQNTVIENASAEDNGFYSVTATETATGCTAYDSVFYVR